MEMEIGEWYYVIPCANCARLVAVYHDQSKGHISLAATRDPNESIPVECLACKHSQFHQVHELRLWHHEE